jgi:hypothetical protein
VLISARYTSVSTTIGVPPAVAGAGVVGAAGSVAGAAGPEPGTTSFSLGAAGTLVSFCALAADFAAGTGGFCSRCHASTSMNSDIEKTMMRMRR